jgi:hypothetical protein
VERKLRVQGRKQGTVRRSLGNARASVAEKVASVDELVLKPIRVIDGKIKLPGSKSLSNRILLLAALSEVCSQISFFPPFTFTVQGLPICRLLARKERKKTTMFSRFQSLLSQQYACFFLPSFGEFHGTLSILRSETSSSLQASKLKYIQFLFLFFFGVVLLYVISMLWKLLIFNFSNCLLTHEPNLPWPKLQP